MNRPLLTSCLTALAALLYGCASNIPTYPLADPDETVATLTARSQQITTISGAGTLVLTRPGRGSVSLDFALVAAAPDRLRVRAWKLHRPVADVTVQGPLERAELDKDLDRAEILAVARRLAQTLPGMDTDPLATQPRKLETSARTINIRWPGESPDTCTVDRPSLTTRRWQFEEGAITLDRHALVAEPLVWPMRVRVANPTGEATLRFDWIELNTELPPRAFPTLDSRDTRP